MDKVRMAIVGCGTISQLNAPGYLMHEHCEITALCDPQPERAEQRAKQWGISPRIHASYEDLLNDSDVDAVELLTPTHLHPQQIVDGLNAGKHVSCQKPISSTVAEIDTIESALQKRYDEVPNDRELSVLSTHSQGQGIAGRGCYRRAVDGADQDRTGQAGQLADCGIAGSVYLETRPHTTCRWDAV